MARPKETVEVIMRRPPKATRSCPPGNVRWVRAVGGAVLIAALFAQTAAAQFTDLRAEHDQRARDLVSRGQLKEAVVEWREALKLAPDSIIIRRNLGMVLLRLGRVEEAEEVLLEAVSLDPSQAASHLYLGRTYLRQGKMRLAESELLTAQSLDPLNPDVDISLAVLATRRDEYGKAESSLKRALTFNYNDPSVHAALGDVYRATGKWDQAEQAYRTALKLDAFHLGAKRGLQETEAGRHQSVASKEARQVASAVRLESPTTRIEGGRFIVEGLVVNNSERATAKYVTVTCQFYGSQQRIIAEKDARAEPDTLKPGQKGRWKVSVPYNQEFSGRMELGVKAIIEDPDAPAPDRQAHGSPAGATSKERAAFFGGDRATKEDVIKVSIPKLTAKGGKTILSGYVVNVGDHPVASIDLNFRIVEKNTGRLYTQDFAHIEQEILKPGERADYTLDWKEGLNLERFRLQMKVGWAELMDGPEESPATEAPGPESTPPHDAPTERLPSPIPEPLPRPIQR